MTTNGVSGDQLRINTVRTGFSRPSVAPPPQDQPGRMAPDQARWSHTNPASQTLAELKAAIGELEQRIATLEEQVDERLIQHEQDLSAPDITAMTPPAGSPKADNEPGSGDRVRKVFDANDRAAAELALNTNGLPSDRVNAELETRSAIMRALQDFDGTGLDESAQTLADGAVSRLGEISDAIAKGEEPSAFAGEIFALRHTLQHPVGAGAHPAVTVGAQVIDRIGAIRHDLKTRLADSPAVNPPAGAQDQAAPEALMEQLDVIDSIENALQGANLTALDEAEEGRIKQSLTTLLDELPDPSRQSFRLTPNRLDEVLALLTRQSRTEATTETASQSSEAETPDADIDMSSFEPDPTTLDEAR